MSVLSDLRRRWLLIVTIAAVAAGVAAGFSFTAAKHYRATAVLVVAPVAPSDPTFLSIDVLHDSDRRTAAATAARLVRASEIAEAVRVRLGLHGSTTSVVDQVDAKVLDRSNAVAVTATDTDSARAAQIANGFVDAFITARSAGFQSEVASAIRRLQQRLAQLSPSQLVSPEGIRLQQRLGDLRALVGTSDPTVRHGSAAVEPASAAWPHPIRWTIYAGVIGLAAGCLIALLLGLVGRLRRRDALPRAEYDPRVSERATDRVVERLEQRLAKRIDALAEEQTRLAARERDLAVRERDVVAKLEELRAAAAVAPTLEPGPEPEPVQPEPVRPEQAAELARREQELAERAELITRREAAVVQRLAELQQLEDRLDEHQAELDHRPEPEPAAPTHEPLPQPLPATTAAPTAAASAAAPDGGWRLAELEQLVEEHGADFPQHLDEWRSYLFYLRDYVDASGRIPGHFDWLIEETFGTLLTDR